MFATLATSRFSLVAAACAGLFCLGLCRVGHTTDVNSPATVIGTSDPFVELRQTSGTPYSWTVEADEVQFSVRDLTAGQFPLQINAGAISNSIRIGNDRKIGFGTSTPERNLHIAVTSGTPTIRFQDSSQDWDIEADVLGFDVVSNPDGANTRPFTILPNAPTASLFVAVNGSIGMGTGSPNVINNTSTGGQCLNVRSATSVARLVGQGQTGGVFDLVHLGNATANQKILRLLNASGFARFQVVKDNLSALTVSDALVIKMSDGNIGLRVANPTNPLQLASGAKCTTAGVWTDACSREFKQDIEPITSAQARDTVRALQAVGYRYKNELDERYVGFIAEDVPELVATNDRKGLAPMDIVGVLTKVVQDQDTQLEQQRKLLNEQQATLAALMKRLDELERNAGGATSK